MNATDNPAATCSFCRRTSVDPTVTMLVAMPDDSAAICGECIEIARDILGFCRQDAGGGAKVPAAPFTVVKPK